MECLICYDKSKIKALTQCGHQALCIVCCFKKRTVSKNNKCLACTQESTKVIATDNTNLQFDDKFCSDDLYFKAEIYAQNKQILSFCLALLDIQCSYQDCFQNFQNIKNYKQHLQEKHRRYLCDLCLEHSTLLITEQKLFRQQELYQHLQIGDKDIDGNLINKHPQCQSCQKYFFDEDQFLRHMHQEHYKCHICEKLPEKKFIFYKDYQQLDLHFQSFHYPCRDQNCIAAKFVVFNVQSSLQKHMQKVHNIQIKLQIFDDKQHEDDLGVDIRDQLISQIKNQKKEDRQIKDYTEFEQEFQRIQLFSILANIKETPIEEEKKIIYAFHHPQSDEGYKYKKLLEEVFFENVKFDLRQEDSINFEIFLNIVSDVLSESKKNFVRSSCIDFIKNQKDEYGLFSSFQNIFGPVLVYKYLYLYSLCCNLNSKKKLQNIISASLYQIPFKVTNILSISKTWEQTFCRATKNIQDTIFDQIKSRKINLQKAIKVSSQRLYQLMREINKISLKDLIKLRYLNMFLCNQSSLQIIRQTFVCSLDHLQRNLQKINSQDLIISFLYFNTALYVFENRTQIKLPRSINPDILKLFIRHFPDLAAEIEFPIESEEEDYDLKTKNRKHSSKKQFDLTCFGKTKYMRKIFIFDKKQQGQNPIELDPDLDFPQLKSEQIDMQLQKRKVISKNIFKEFKNTEEDFPQLLSDNKVAKNNNKKDPKQSSQIKKTHNISQNVQNLPKKLGKEDFPSLGTYQNTDQELDSFQKLRKEQISVKKKHITQPQNCQFNKKQFPQLSQQSMTTPEENLMEKRLRNIEDMKFRGKKKQNYDKKFNLFNDNKLQQNLKKKNQKIVIYSDEEKQEVEQIINKQVQKIDLKDLKFGKNFNAQNSKLIKDKQNDVLIDKNIIQNTQVLKDEDFPSAFPDLETKDNSVNIFQRQNEKKDLKKIYDQRFNIRQQEKQINKEEDIKKKHKNKKKGKKVVLLQLQFQNKMFLKTLNLINNYTTKTSNLPFIFFRHIGQFLSSNQFAQELQYVQ